DRSLARALLFVRALGLVTIEGIGAQPNAKPKVGRLIGLDGGPGKVRDDRGGVRRAGNPAHGKAAKLHEIPGLELAPLADAEHDQARRIKAGGGHDVEGGAAFSLEALSRGRARNEIAARCERPARCLAELEPFFAEPDEDTL